MLLIIPFSTASLRITGTEAKHKTGGWVIEPSGWSWENMQLPRTKSFNELFATDNNNFSWRKNSTVCHIFAIPHVTHCIFNPRLTRLNFYSFFGFSGVFKLVSPVKSLTGSWCQGHKTLQDSSLPHGTIFWCVYVWFTRVLRFKVCTVSFIFFLFWRRGTWSTNNLYARETLYSTSTQSQVQVAFIFVAVFSAHLC